jgi:alkylation response protein AidB-like acyl-CoA dehydrogenase
MRRPGISVRPIRFPDGRHDFNEVVFEDVVLPDDVVLGEVDGAWKQATSELAYERSGPERFLETLPVLIELIDVLGPQPGDRGAEGLGRLAAQLFTLRRMSISVAGMLTAGKEPVLEASIVKDLATVWEQRLPDVCRDLAALADADPAVRARFDAVLRRNLLIAPKLTIQGGSTEILRGIIARGLGLR